MSKTLSYSVCLHEPSLESAFQDFHRKVWPSKNLSAGDTPTNVHPGAVSSPVFLFLKSREIIGHLGTMPATVRNGQRTVGGHWIVGLMVLPEFRNGLVGPQLIKKVNDTLSFAMTLHVEESVSRIVKGLKWTHLGVIPQYVHVINGKRLAQQLRLDRIGFLAQDRGVLPSVLRYLVKHPVTHAVTGIGASILRSAWLCAVTRKPGRSPDVTVGAEGGFDATYDQLWEEVKDEFGALVVRDQAYLTAKYAKEQGAFRILAFRAQSRLRAFVIVKIRQFKDDERMGNARIATIIDCLFSPREDKPINWLLHEVRCMCEREEVDAIFCTASQRMLRQQLARHAYIEIPGSLRFAYFDRDHALDGPIPLNGWHIMRGDADAAANL